MGSFLWNYTFVANNAKKIWLWKMMLKIVQIVIKTPSVKAKYFSYSLRYELLDLPRILFKKLWLKWNEAFAKWRLKYLNHINVFSLSYSILAHRLWSDVKIWSCFVGFSAYVSCIFYFHWVAYDLVHSTDTVNNFGLVEIFWLLNRDWFCTKQKCRGENNYNLLETIFHCIDIQVLIILVELLFLEVMSLRKFWYQ